MLLKIQNIRDIKEVLLQLLIFSDKKFSGSNTSGGAVRNQAMSNQ